MIWNAVTLTEEMLSHSDNMGANSGEKKAPELWKGLNARKKNSYQSW